MSSVQSTTKELLNYSQTPFFVGEGKDTYSDPADLSFSKPQKKPKAKAGRPQLFRKVSPLGSQRTYMGGS